MSDFPQAQPKTPTTLGNIVVVLKDAVATEEGPAYQNAHFTVPVLDQDGNMMRDYQGDLEPHLTPAEKASLMGFMTTLRARAEVQIL